MRILVATNRTQNDRPGDFSFAPEGEPVTAGSYATCDSHLASNGGLSNCGCDRAFKTIDSGKSTTTALVIERDITRDALVEAFAKRVAAEWNETEAEVREVAEAEVDEMLGAAAALTLDAIVGHDIESFFAR